jgi:methylenetetrahydrofolate dehydrogenase (NAD+)
VDVTGLAQQMRASVREYTNSLGDNRVKLLSILAHDGPYRRDAELYAELIAQTCYEDGIDYEQCRVLGEKPCDVEEAIQSGNERSDVDGILVYYPVFKKRLSALQEERGPYKNRLTGVYYKTYDDYLRDLVCCTKDVEGLCQEYNARWIYRARGKEPLSGNNNNDLYPCAAASVFQILEAYHSPLVPNSWKGTVVTIINRSEIFGRPLAAMLANAGASVYSVDVDSILLFRDGGRIRRCNDSTKTLEVCVRKSSVVVSGVPYPDFTIPCEWIKEGTTFVNVSEYPNVCEETLMDIPGLQYIPHVGKVTIAVLEQNLIKLSERH